MTVESLTEGEYEPIRRALFDRSNGSASAAKAALAECLAEDGYAIVRRDDLNLVVNGAFGSQYSSQYHDRLRAALGADDQGQADE